MTNTALDAAIDDALHSIVDTDQPPTSTSKPAAYIATVPVAAMFADPAYQRALDDLRVQRMAEAFDVSLLGIIEASQRADGRYAIIDGQHRWAVVREINGAGAHMVCNVHRGLTPADEARLFFDIDRGRRALTGWDRWWARRGSGDPAVLDIEAVVGGHDLTIAPATRDGVVRATRACERVVELGGLELLDQTLALLVTAWGRAADALDGELIHGVALVLHHYNFNGEVDPDRLLTSWQDVAPRQIKARARALREAHRGELPRLVAAVLIERYNAGKGRAVDDFLTRVPAGRSAKTKPSPQQRRDDAIRAWARRHDIPLALDGWRIPKTVRSRYDADHGQPG